ncbi:MAG: hypothetical protein R2762_01480 [Bryobacteraceae bacterium]
MVAILLALIVAGNLDAAWRRAASPHFELLTDSSENNARRWMEQLEQLRQVFGQSSGSPATPLPLRVFVFKSEREFARLRPTPHTRAFFQGGPERDLIVALDAGEQTTRALNHEYIHAVLNHSTSSLPLWLEEGTAEFYSTIRVDEDRLTLGLPIPEHPRTLATGGWLGHDEFFASGRGSQLHNEARRVGAFYAQSWAMAHMLNMAPGFRQQLPRYAQLLDQAMNPADAFQEAFAMSQDDALGRLHAYVSHGSYPVARVQGGSAGAAPVETAELTGAEAAQARVELLLLLNRPDDAERLLRGLDPGDAEVQTALGLFALAQKQDQQALDHFRQAIEKGARAATPYFEYAMLLRDTNAPAGEVRRYLAEAAGRNPKHAEAHFLLGLESQKEGRHGEALESFQAALAVLPRQSYFWHATALTLRALGRDPEAARAARKAMDTSRTTHEFEMAGTLRRSLAQAASAPPAPPRKPKPAVTTPESWSMPAGDARVEGVLEHIDCYGSSARFQVRSRDGVVRLWVDNPGEVLLRTESALTFIFSCGAQQPRPVTIEYRALADPKRKTQGVITAISFR